MYVYGTAFGERNGTDIFVALDIEQVEKKNGVFWMLRRVALLTRAKRRDLPEDAILHSHRRENLKSNTGGKDYNSSEQGPEVDFPNTLSHTDRQFLNNSNYHHLSRRPRELHILEGSAFCYTKITLKA
jgi:hypothetical protein